MSDLLRIGASGVRAYQSALDVVGHNITNANVAGYARRTAQIAENASATSGYALVTQGSSGSGAVTTGVARAYNAFLANDARLAAGDFARSDTERVWLSEVETYLNHDTQALGGRLNAFFNAAQEVAADPVSIAARDSFLSAAHRVADGFRSTSQALASTRAGITDAVEQTVDRINRLSASLAVVNQSLLKAQDGSSEAAALCDDRDRLLDELAGLVKIDVSERAGGGVTVRLEHAGGAQLVDGIGWTQLGGAIEEGRLALRSGVSGVRTTLPSSGTLAGLADALVALDTSAVAIDRLATSFVAAVNRQHQQGTDLNGRPGGDLFDAQAITATPSRANGGQPSVAIRVDDPGRASPAGYELRYRAATSQWTLSFGDGRAAVSGSGPFDVDGLHIAVGGAPADGDWYKLGPSAGAAGVTALVSDPAAVAAAAAQTVAPAASNQGGATAASYSDPAANAARPLPAYTLRFTAADRYELVDPANNSLLASGRFEPDASIPVAGFSIRVAGAPAVGDSFAIRMTPAGSADNSNMRALVATRASGGFEAGYTRVVTRTATELAGARSLANARQSLRDEALATRSAATAVNLDEEAADLIRLQQAYQASAKVIAAARELFTTILNIG